MNNVMDDLFKTLEYFNNAIDDINFRIMSNASNDDNGDTTHDDGAYEPENLPTYEPEESDVA